MSRGKVSNKNFMVSPGTLIPIVIPNEKITKRFRVVIAPNLFAISVILIGNIFVFQFAVKSFLRRKRFADEFT